MIDIHCHIIPKVDDGSVDEKMSLEMGKKAYELGYRGIFATSHYILHDNELDIKKYKREIEKVNKLFKSNNIKVKVYTGNEIFFTNDILKMIKTKKVCTLGDSKYILVELPLFNKIIPMNVYEEFNALQDAGYRPILAHPERYDFVTKDIELLTSLIESGVLIQSNIASITGKYGSNAKKNVIKMLKNDMVHFLGSDSHNISVYKTWNKAMKKIIKIVNNAETINAMLNENPRFVLENKEAKFWYPKYR